MYRKDILVMCGVLVLLVIMVIVGEVVTHNTTDLSKPFVVVQIVPVSKITVLYRCVGYGVGGERLSYRFFGTRNMYKIGQNVPFINPKSIP